MYSKEEKIAKKHTATNQHPEYPENLQLYYQGLKEDKIVECGKLLVSKGFTENGDKSYTKNSGALNGKKYSKITIWFENNETDEWMVNLTGE